MSNFVDQSVFTPDIKCHVTLIDSACACMCVCAHVNSLCGCIWRIYELCWEIVGKELVSHDESRNRLLFNLTTKPEHIHTLSQNTKFILRFFS